jgi:transposase
MNHSTCSTIELPNVLTKMSVEVPTAVGLDLSDECSHFCVRRGDGLQIEAGKVFMVNEDLSKLFTKWKGCRLVIEAGCHSPWVGRLGRTCGMEVIVANPRQVDLISKSNSKTDANDAALLARLAVTPELLSPIIHRSKQAQSHLAVVRSRDVAVRTRTGLINHVRGTLKSSGFRAPSASSKSFGGRVSASIPSELQAALLPIVCLLKTVNEQIKMFDKEIERLGQEEYPVTQLLRQIAGVGPVASLTFVLTVDDPTRFTNTREVGAYVGLVPKKKSSGESDPQLHITKAGDREMRRLLVLCANYILGRQGPDCDLKRFGMKIAGDGTSKIAKKKARVAVARKLAVLMLHLWKTGEVYDPLYLAKQREQAVAI